MAVPLAYSLRNVLVRRAAALLTALGIALTVAVFGGVFALRAGFRDVYRSRGDDDLAIYLRRGATSEGESGFDQETADILVKERPEIARDDKGQPLAAAESFLAVFMDLLAGGRTNVPLRGIDPQSLALHGEDFRLVEGRLITFGADEMLVGKPLTERIANCRLGDVITLNTTPFRVVGVFELASAAGSEIWGDAQRMMEALDRRIFQRVVARLVAGTDLGLVEAELAKDPRMSIRVFSERAYLEAQTTMLGSVLKWLGVFLTTIMSIAAVTGAMNTMLAAVAGRVHEIGILLALGYSRASIFLAFLVEATAIGALGGALGVLLILPLDGIRTGAMNYNTFTDVSFEFRATPAELAAAFSIALLLGMLGGVVPALSAARRKPVDALRMA